jgi:hypothetical protein
LLRSRRQAASRHSDAEYQREHCSKMYRSKHICLLELQKIAL